MKDSGVVIERQHVSAVSGPVQLGSVSWRVPAAPMATLWD